MLYSSTLLSICEIAEYYAQFWSLLYSLDIDVFVLQYEQSEQGPTADVESPFWQILKTRLDSALSNLAYFKKNFGQGHWRPLPT